MCLPARESVDQVECLPASATRWLSPDRSFFDLARTMKSGQNQMDSKQKALRQQKQFRRSLLCKSGAGKVCDFVGVNFENSLGEALILDIPVKFVITKLRTISYNRSSNVQ